MGFDGISVNQLRMNQESNTSEVNSVRFNSQNSEKTIDGLAKGQIVNPDGKNKQDNQETFDDFDEQETEEENETPQEEVIKYDLTRSDKYAIKLDSDEKTILIIDKTNDIIVQKVNSESLSRFVGFLSSSQGAMINRKL